MNRIIQFLCLLNTVLFSLPLSADPFHDKGDYWECHVRDSTNKRWVGVSAYELTASTKAMDYCKKESSVPLSCRAEQDECEGFINNESTRANWQCTALDQMAKAWNSTYYRHQDDAALAAEADCRQHSPYPETCYTNLLTCRNLNAQE